jgi:hypothetical protein
VIRVILVEDVLIAVQVSRATKEKEDSMVYRERL